MDKELRSYILYFGLIIFLMIFGEIAEKRNNKFLVFIIAAVLTIPMGLRKKTVGLDTYNYYWMIERIHGFSYIFQFSDPFFYAYTYIIRIIGIDDSYFVYFVISLFGNFLVIYRLWSLRKVSSFKYCLLRYFTLFYFFAINCMRQFWAISIVFYVSKYIKEEKYGKFAFWVLFASTIHLSALISFLYLSLEIIRKDELSQRHKNLASLSFLALPVTIGLTFLVSRGRYESYFEEVRIFRPSSLIYKVIIFVLAFAFMHFENRFKKENYEEFMCFVYYFVGLAFNAFGVFFPLVERAGYYFYIYATAYLGILANNKRFKFIIRLIILIIVIRSFYLNCTSNSMGQIPYRFNWE